LDIQLACHLLHKNGSIHWSYNINKDYKNTKCMQIGFLKCMTNFHDKAYSQKCLVAENNGFKGISDNQAEMKKRNIISCSKQPKSGERLELRKFKSLLQ